MKADRILSYFTDRLIESERNTQRLEDKLDQTVREHQAEKKKYLTLISQLESQLSSINTGDKISITTKNISKH